jgi:putative membrane protein
LKINRDKKSSNQYLLFIGDLFSFRRMEKMELIGKGLLIGIIIVLPGMSGGTVFLVLGLYEKIIRDLAQLKLKPYIPLLFGLIGGVLIGGLLLSYVFYQFRDLSAAFLLGCLLASIRPILKGQGTKNPGIIGLLAIGFVVGYLMAGEPIELGDPGESASYLRLIIGGALASATMIIPGLPGSGVLILMGIYDDALFYLGNFQFFTLTIMGISGLLGVFILARGLEKLYRDHRKVIAYTFSGLIAGSARAIIPYEPSLGVLLLFVLGFTVVGRDGEKKGGA